MRVEIADLGERVSAPDLWDDQADATRVTGRLSLLQGEVDRVSELGGRLDDLELMVQLGREEDDAATLAVRMEEDSAVAWRAVLEQATTTDDRTLAVTALTEAAVTAARWRAVLGTSPTTVAFPGGSE